MTVDLVFWQTWPLVEQRIHARGWDTATGEKITGDMGSMKGRLLSG